LDFSYSGCETEARVSGPRQPESSVAGQVDCVSMIDEIRRFRKINGKFVCGLKNFFVEDLSGLKDLTGL